MTIPNQAVSSAYSGFVQGNVAGTLPGIEAGQPLEDFLQQMVAGVSGLDGEMVFPRWQADAPVLPPWGTDWAAIGTIERRNLGYSAVIHRGEGDGYDELQRHEEFDLLCSFYGPKSLEFITNLHDGLGIWQNYSMLRKVGVALVDVGTTRRLPEIIKNSWTERSDKMLTFRRIIIRNYPILNLLSAKAEIITGNYTAIANVVPTP